MKLKLIKHTKIKNCGLSAVLDVCAKICAWREGFAVVSSEHSGGSSFIFLNPVSRFSWKQAPTTQFWGQFDQWVGTSFYAQEAKGEEVPPLCAGYLSYETLHTIEDLPEPEVCTRATLNYPYALFYLYSLVIRVPADLSSEIQISEINYDQTIRPLWYVEPPSLIEQLSSTTPSISSDAFLSRTDSQALARLATHGSCTATQYQNKVAAIKELIAQGEVYQVNLSQRFSLPFDADPFLLFQNLLGLDQCTHSSFLSVSAEEKNRQAIISASPELFFSTEKIKIRCGPIKGTTPRLVDETQDLANQSELLASSKNRAELSMIVDLIRNDLGKIAAIGSVAVEKHAQIRTLKYVHHLFSEISAELRPSTSLSEILQALFPCGSITGAPKIAAMKAISHFEDTPRGIYTGSIGIWGPGRKSEFSVAIRTSCLVDNKLVFGSGGGIVFDSEPAEEYQETLHKALNIFLSWEKTTVKAKAA